MDDGVTYDPNQRNGSLRPQAGTLVGSCGDRSDNDEPDTGHAFTEDIDSPTSNFGGDEPCADRSNESKCCAAESTEEGVSIARGWIYSLWHHSHGE